MRERFVILVCLSITALLGTGCKSNQPTQPKNHPPEIQNITTNPQTSYSNRVSAGDSVVIAVTATDPDKDQLQYSWQCTQGTFLSGQNAQLVTWISPIAESVEPCIISITVSDGALLTRDSITVYVSAAVVGFINGHAVYAGTNIPVSGVDVGIDGKHYTTSADGFYHIEKILVGNKVLKASKDGYDIFLENIVIVPNSNSREIPMTSALYTHNLYGTVSSSVTNIFLSNTSVVVLNNDDSESQLHTTSDSKGYYQVPSVPQGQRKIKFRRQNFQTFITQVYMSNSDYNYDVQLLNKPGFPSNPNPSDGANVIWSGPSLGVQWTCSDPSMDVLHYDILLGTTNPPLQQVSQNQTSTNIVLKELEPNTTYFWKIIAKDDYNNITEGPVWRFTINLETGSVTDVAGNKYKTVKIGNQWWMAENLKVTCYRNGDVIPNISDNAQWANLKTGAYCNYGNSPVTADTYGRLYNWYAIKDYRGLAPVGWHVPTDKEWQMLVDYLGGSSVSGVKLRESGTTHWNSSKNGEGSNESGFTALPGGFRIATKGLYDGIGITALFWTSTESNSMEAIWWGLSFSLPYAWRLTELKNAGLSVRCIKD